jgi:hypothetical protein
MTQTMTYSMPNPMRLSTDIEGTMFNRLILCCTVLVAQSVSAQGASQSPRMAALNFAKNNGIAVPENVIILRETRADSTRPGPKATTLPEARQHDAAILASSLGPSVRIGSVRDFLLCRKLICAGKTDQPVLVVEDARTDAKGTTVLIQLFQTVRVNFEDRKTIFVALVQVKQVSEGWIADGFRNRPGQAWPKVPPP